MQIKYYQKSNGRMPAKEFIRSIENKKLKVKVYEILSLMVKYEEILKEPYCKHLEDGIYELRIRFGTDSVRCLYFYHENNTIVITNGFMKKTQKTPKSVIETAKKYRKDYYERKYS